MSKMSRMAMGMLLLLLVIGTCANAAAPATRPGSFLSQKASNPQELASMVKKNPVLSVRYAQHYGMSPAAVANYFESNLKLVRLRSELKTNVYFVDAKGRILRKVKTLPAGRLVFATEDGEPMLDWECGNPLTTNLPEKKKQVEKFEPAPEVVEMVMPEPPVEIMASLAAPVMTVPVVAAVPLVEAAVVPATTSVSMLPAISANYSGGLALLSLAAVSFANHKSSSPPVPEPSAFFALGSMGLAGSLGYIRARRRRND